MATTTTISLEAARRADVTPKQREFCKHLIGLGLARTTITALMLAKDAATLSPADINAGMRTINSCIKELGYNIVDARHGLSPVMAVEIRKMASKLKVAIKVA